MTLNITFLGTSDAVPSAERNHTSILLTYEGENILVDCGEGTQRQFRKARLNPCKITRILITHWHADHVLGLPGLLKTMELTGYNKTLCIYGPKGIRNRVEKMFEAYGNVNEYKIIVQEVSGKFLDAKDFYIEAEEMVHGVKCVAYNFVKKGQVRIDKEKLEKFKIPSTKELQNLKEGKSVSVNGKKYSAKQLTFKEEDLKISFVLDTSENNKIVPFVKNSDLLICEATYDSDLEDLAKERGHLTLKQSAEIAKKSKAKKLILTHISQRHYPERKRLLEDAKKIFKETVLVKDLDAVEI
jgi:ribonuclease Z